MAQFETWLKCDLAKVPVVQTLNGVMFTQDAMGNKVGCIVTNNDSPVSLTGTITGYVIRSDNVTVAVEGDSSENRAWIELPEQAYAVVGPILIVIRETVENTKTVLCACNAVVLRSRTNAVIDPGRIVGIVNSVSIGGGTAIGPDENGEVKLPALLPISGGTMTGALMLYNASGVFAASFPRFVFKLAADGDAMGQIAYSTSYNSFIFQSNNPSDTSKYVRYRLPEPTFDSSNKTYYILTNEPGGSSVYASGDTFTQSDRMTFAAYTYTKKRISITVPVHKSLEAISSVSVTSLIGSFGGINGIVGPGSGDSFEWVGRSGITVTAYKRTDHLLEVNIISTAELNNAVQYTPISAFVKVTLLFS